MEAKVVCDRIDVSLRKSNRNTRPGWGIRLERHVRNCDIKQKEGKTQRDMLGGLVGWFYGISTFVDYLTPNRFLYKKTVIFQTILFSMSTSLIVQTFLFHVIQVGQTVLIQRIQFNICINFVNTVKCQNSSKLQLNYIWPIDRTLSSATFPRPESTWERLQ